ncbi:hypothetical protein FRC14_004945 [Serendipita sp. 396]|nr:hypothetical protein FRC14_004945 [Serendipita sp. 396]KAG8781536.1 hypothetical protein FRC15_008580 [Serendipita sp. 397]KAG8797742.1 hypothetical protein FRC16_008577 [Serendipita sp. 398]KAG8836259.1 hypothetical protein FRC18_011650 [Serendipita sp. 400]KAG8866375.1 hypothetical protein FRC20_008689 [Serendipita sp. 405]
MSLVPQLPPDLLLCVFVHGFKGNDSTFLDFPSRLEHNLRETVDNVTVESLLFPVYETKGELSAAVNTFVEWLQHEVINREVKRAVELGGNHGAAGAAKVVLCGHSMGGLVIADAMKAIKKSHNDDGPLWPRIIAVLAYDTPYLGLHPDMFKNKATEGLSYVSAAQGVFAGLGTLGLWGASSTPKSGGSNKDGKKDTTAVVPGVKPLAQGTASSSSSSWTKWAAIGGAVVAGGTAAAAWYHKDALASGVTYGWSFLTDHFKFVSSLMNEETMKQRLDEVVETSKARNITFRAFYTYLPKKLGQPRPRTFMILPSQNATAAPYFVAATNSLASDEVQAHIGMFDAKSNDGYYELGLKTTHLIREAICTLMENERTMEVRGATSDTATMNDELEANREAVGRDGREAEAIGKPDKPDLSAVSGT